MGSCGACGEPDDAKTGKPRPLDFVNSACLGYFPTRISITGYYIARRGPLNSGHLWLSWRLVDNICSCLQPSLDLSRYNLMDEHFSDIADTFHNTPGESVCSK